MNGKGMFAAVLLIVAVFVAIPAEAVTGDLISSSSTLVIFKLDRDSGYGYYLSPDEAYQVVYGKIIPELRKARPNDYRTYFDRKPEKVTSKYAFDQVLVKDLMFHYNFLRWDNDIGFNDWYISESYWNE